MLDDATEQKWLAITLGDDEAAQAMTLPRELRHSLYGDVLSFGPAANEVTRMLAAVDSAKEGKSVAKLFELLDSLAWSNHLTEPLSGLNAPTRSVWKTAEKDGYADLEELLIAACAEKNHGAFYYGARILGWMLNGQYIFRREDVATDAAPIRIANQILDILELPRLHGVFTPAPKDYSKWSYQRMYGAS